MQVGIYDNSQLSDRILRVCLRSPDIWIHDANQGIFKVDINVWPMCLGQ